MVFTPAVKTLKSTRTPLPPRAGAAGALAPHAGPLQSALPRAADWSNERARREEVRSILGDELERCLAEQKGLRETTRDFESATQDAALMPEAHAASPATDEGDEGVRQVIAAHRAEAEWRRAEALAWHRVSLSEQAASLGGASALIAGLPQACAMELETIEVADSFSEELLSFKDASDLAGSKMCFQTPSDVVSTAASASTSPARSPRGVAFFSPRGGGAAAGGVARVSPTRWIL